MQKLFNQFIKKVKTQSSYLVQEYLHKDNYNNLKGTCKYDDVGFCQQACRAADLSHLLIKYQRIEKIQVLSIVVPISTSQDKEYINEIVIPCLRSRLFSKISRFRLEDKYLRVVIIEKNFTYFLKSFFLLNVVRSTLKLKDEKKAKIILENRELSKKFPKLSICSRYHILACYNQSSSFINSYVFKVTVLKNKNEEESLFSDKHSVYLSDILTKNTKLDNIPWEHLKLIQNSNNIINYFNEIKKLQ